MLHKTYAVVAHGVRIEGINVENQQNTIQQLLESNKRLHPGIHIERITWLTSTRREGQTHASLIVEVTLAEAANRMILVGVVEG